MLYFFYIAINYNSENKFLISARFKCVRANRKRPIRSANNQFEINRITSRKFVLYIYVGLLKSQLIRPLTPCWTNMMNTVCMSVSTKFSCKIHDFGKQSIAPRLDNTRVLYHGWAFCGLNFIVCGGGPCHLWLCWHLVFIFENIQSTYHTIKYNVKLYSLW